MTADIHGDAEKFHELLCNAPILPQDTLYILGDIIDRGSSGVDIIREIRKRSNVVLLKGNHEQMCVDTLGQKNILGAKELWLHNGGESTCADLSWMCSAEERQDIVHYLSTLPEQLTITVNGRNYILVHAAPGETSEIRLWARPDTIHWEDIIPENTTAIIGHTPTKFISNDRNSPMRIWHDQHFICVDCGCGER